MKLARPLARPVAASIAPPMHDRLEWKQPAPVHPVPPPGRAQLRSLGRSAPMCASRRMNGTSGASWFSRRYEASSGDGAEPVIGPRYARTRWRLLTMRGAPGPKLSIALQHEVL